MKKPGIFLIASWIIFIGILYSTYLHTKKATFENEVNQMKLNMILLEFLNQGETERVGKLLSISIENAMVYLVEYDRLEDMDKLSLCKYINEDRIKLLKDYDENLPIFYVDKVVEYCLGSSE